jgi:hypothetical protein
MAKRASSDDPSVRTLKGGAPEYPEGTHPIHPVSEQTWNGERFSYSDLDDEQKPDPSSVISEVEEDPIEVDKREALEADAKHAAKNPPETASE